MRPGFLALLSTGVAANRLPAVAARLQRLTSLREVITAPALRVFVRAETQATQLSPTRVLVGSVYARTGPIGCPLDVAAYRSFETGEALATRLADTVWGDYVAFAAPPGGGRAIVYRSPCGLLPCFVLRCEELLVAASDAALLAEAGLPLETDWDYLAAHLLAPNLRPVRTAHRGVTELCPGALISADRPERQQAMWTPWTFAVASRRVEDIDEAVDLVRREIINAVAHRASAHRRILLGLSGGLDSSIVAAALRKAGADFTCVNFVSGPASGDERHYASIMANAVSAPLVEVADSVSDLDLLTSTSRHLPRPNARSFAQSNDHMTSELAARLGATAHFTGGGGDNVFCSLQSASPVADRIIAHGLGVGAAETAADMAAITETAWGTVLRKAIGRAWFGRRAYRWPLDSSLLTMDAVRRGTAHVEHPWLDAPPDALPGKAAHIAWLLGIQNHLDGFEREETLTLSHPLMSQPIVEACLRVPTWQWCHGGINRAVARRAFRAELPAEIYRRASKGSPFRLMIEVATSNLELIGAELASGQLARHGLLDTSQLDTALTRAGGGEEAACSRLLGLMDVEAWLRSQAVRTPPMVWS